MGLLEYQFDAGFHVWSVHSVFALGPNFSSSGSVSGTDMTYGGVTGEATIGSLADIGASAGIGGLSPCQDGEKSTLSFGAGKYAGIQFNWVGGHFNGISLGLGLGLSLPVTFTTSYSNFLNMYAAPDGH